MAVFTARYPGHCGVCDEPVTPGDPAVYDADDRVVHADCGAAAPPPVLHGTQCPHCHMTMSLSGVCDCRD